MAKFNIRESFKKKQFRYGGYAALMTAVVLAIVIIINLIAGMDRFSKKIDLTQNKMFSLSDESKKILKNINKKVTFVGLYEKGKDDSDTNQIKEILKQYQNASKNIDIQYVDPVLNPGYMTEYKDAANIQTGSVIVKSGSKYKVIAPTEMYNYDYSNYDQSDPNSTPQRTSIAAEQKFTAAIMYVTADKNPTIYSLQGQEEEALPTAYSQYFADQNFTLKDMDLLKEDLKPQSGDILFIDAPKRDISDNEYNKIKDYLAGGGRAMFLMSLSEGSIPNFNKLLDLYGLTVNKSLVIEGDESYMFQSQITLVPEIQNQTITTPMLDKKLNVLISQAMPIQQSKVKKDTVKIESLLKTSDKAYGRVDLTKTMVAKQSSDIDGPFDLGVAVTDTVDQANIDKNAKLVVFSSPTILDQTLMQYSNGANIDLFLNSMNWLSERKDNITILPKNLGVSPLNMNQGQSLTVSAIAVIFIPGLIAVAGVCVWLRRRHL